MIHIYYSYMKEYFHLKGKALIFYAHTHTHTINKKNYIKSKILLLFFRSVVV